MKPNKVAGVKSTGKTENHLLKLCFLKTAIVLGWRIAWVASKIGLADVYEKFYSRVDVVFFGSCGFYSQNRGCCICSKRAFPEFCCFFCVSACFAARKLFEWSQFTIKS